MVRPLRGHWHSEFFLGSQELLSDLYIIKENYMSYSVQERKLTHSILQIVFIYVCGTVYSTVP